MATTKTTPENVTIETPGGQTFTIEFHRTAYRCWHVIFPRYVDCNSLPYPELGEADGDSILHGDYVYTGPTGGAVLATSSLERGMAVVADHICRTEF